MGVSKDFICDTLHYNILGVSELEGRELGSM